MKLTVIGGTGLIGSQVFQKLTAAGHQAVPAALSTGLDLITGKGLDQALEGAEVVVNVANAPTFDEASVGFFRTSMNNLLAAGEHAGAGHQVILSIVGVDQVPQLDYYRAKTLQEDLLGRLTLAVQHDNRTVITDDKAGAFAGVTGDVLTAGPDAHLAPTHYQDWIQTPR